MFFWKNLKNFFFFFFFFFFFLLKNLKNFFFFFFFFFFDILTPFGKILPENIQLFQNVYWKCLNLRKMSWFAVNLLSVWFFTHTFTMLLIILEAFQVSQASWALLIHVVKFKHNFFNVFETNSCICIFKC